LGAKQIDIDIPVTAPATDAAQQWQGWGTALKPAFEPIIVARKPLRGTVAENVQRYGTGALNIDACRVGTTVCTNRDEHGQCRGHRNAGKSTSGETIHGADTIAAGRWPTNVVLDDTQAAELDAQSGIQKDGIAVQRNGGSQSIGNTVYNTTKRETSMIRPDTGYGGEGGASRFFPTFHYQAKASNTQRPNRYGVAHPTVKPLDLMLAGASRHTTWWPGAGSVRRFRHDRRGVHRRGHAMRRDRNRRGLSAPHRAAYRTRQCRCATTETT